MAHEPFKGRRPIFIGDDVTDEAVFGIMPDLGGLAFSVGRHATGVSDYFDEPRDVREWLAHLLDDEAAAGPRSKTRASFTRFILPGPFSAHHGSCSSHPHFSHFFPLLPLVTPAPT